MRWTIDIMPLMVLHAKPKLVKTDSSVTRLLHHHSEDVIRYLLGSLTERCYEVEATLSATLTQLAADNPDDAEKLELQEQNNMIERQTPSHAETPKYKPQVRPVVIAQRYIDSPILIVIIFTFLFYFIFFSFSTRALLGILVDELPKPGFAKEL